MNINIVAMDGGHKSVATGLASYRSIKHHHNVRTMQHSRSFMDVPNSELHTSNWRMGRLIAESGVKLFQIETTLNTDTFPEQLGFLQKREWEWTIRDRAAFVASSTALDRSPGELTRRIFHAVRAPHNLTSVQAGAVEAVHESTLANVHRQQIVEVTGQTDVLTMGLPYICPYNVNSTMNPILVACLGLGYFFNLYRGKPLVREGGVVIMSHPTPWEFNPVHHPSYIDFFEQVLAETTDQFEIESKFEESFATDPVVRAPIPDELRLPRRPSLLHVVLVRARSPAPRPGDRRRREPGRCAPHGLLAGVDARGCSRDRRRRGRPGPDDHPLPRSAGHVGRRHVTRRVRGAAASGREGLRFVAERPTRPAGVAAPLPHRSLGVDYDTSWARRYPVRLARAVLLDDVTRPIMKVALSPRVTGLEHLDPVPGPDDPRRQPRQPSRHRPAPLHPSGAAASPHDGRGGG